MKYALTGLLLFSSVLATPLFGNNNENGSKQNKGAGNSASPARAGAGNAAAGNAAAGNAAAPAATAPKPAAAAGPKPAAPMSTGTTAPKPAAPLSSGTAGPKPAAAGAMSETMAQAAANWAKDTAVVSNFLNLAPTLTGQEFVQQAQIAYDAEVDELNHKAVLDTNPMITSGADVKGANATLVGAGKFQDVVDVLKAMVETGDSVGQTDADAINANRCVNVLPNIDIYLAAAGTNFKSTRPNACDANGVKAGGAATSGSTTAGAASAQAPAAGSGSSTTTTGTSSAPANAGKGAGSTQGTTGTGATAGSTTGTDSTGTAAQDPEEMD